MALSWRYGRLAVLVFVAGAVAMASIALLGPPEARADGILRIHFVTPHSMGDVPFYVARYKLRGDKTAEHDSTWQGGITLGAQADPANETRNGTITWESEVGVVVGLGVVDDVANALLKAAGTDRGTASVTIKDVPHYSGQRATGTSAVMQVFDAELTSPAVGEEDELTKPTFIGPGCTKEFTITVNPAAGDLPTPTNPAFDDSQKHWAMQLTFDNVPGVSFRDANDNPIEANPTTHEPLRTLSWGWMVESSPFPPHWVHPTNGPLGPGVTPPGSIKLGTTGEGAATAVHLTLTLTIWHNRISTVATDSILVVPVAIAQTPDRSVGDERNLWYFGLNYDNPHELNQPTYYPVKLTLAAPPLDFVDGHENFLYDWKTTYTGNGRIAFQEADGPRDEYLSAAGVNNVLVFANAASSKSDAEDHHDIGVKLRIADQDAAVGKLTVYVPYSEFLYRQPRAENQQPNPYDENGGTGYNTFYYFLPCDQFKRSLPNAVVLECVEAFYSQHAVAPYTDQTYDWGEPVPLFMLLDGTGFQDKFGREGLLLRPVPINPIPWQPLVDEPVCDGYQDYLVGCTVHGFGIVLHHHTIHWFRGKARVDPEPPVGQGTF